LRPSELVWLDVPDLTVVEDGLAVSLMRGRIVIPYGIEPDLCPVLAWQDWEAAAGLTAGPAFRSVDRDGRLGLTRLGERAITRMVQRAAERAGLDESRYSALSLRLGMLASARPRARRHRGRRRRPRRWGRRRARRRRRGQDAAGRARPSIPVVRPPTGVRRARWTGSVRCSALPGRRGVRARSGGCRRTAHER